MPVSSRRRRRSAAAGPERPIRRASSAIRSRGAAWSSATIRRSTSSSRVSGISKAWRTKFRCFDGIFMVSPALLPFSTQVSASYAALVPNPPQAAEAAEARSAGPERPISAADPASGVPPTGPLDRIPPQSFFLVSAVFHYLGPSLAVLLFARLDVLGVAWLRIASAAVVLALWRRPWRLVRKVRKGRRLGVAGGQA